MLSIAKDAERALRNGVNFNTTSQCVADVNLGVTKPMCKYLRDFKIETMMDFFYVIKNLNGMSEEDIKTLYKYRKKSQFNELIALYKTVNLKSWLEIYGVNYDDFRLCYEHEWKKIVSFFRTGAQTKIKRRIKEYNDMLCMSSLSI